jgi:hypothetical protein
MTFLRKWRFPILIGSGLIAASVLIYFANTHISSDKTQGAIGKRDVYRDAQNNSADVATPGSAPVATEAILQSSEYKSLMKTAAFQELLHSDAFNGSHRKAIADLLARSEFQAAVQDVRFAALVRSDAFQLALRSHADLFVALKDQSEFKALDSNGLRMLLKNEGFLRLAHEQAFQRLLASNALRENLRNQAFLALISRSDFQSMLVNHGEGHGGPGGR